MFVALCGNPFDGFWACRRVPVTMKTCRSLSACLLALVAWPVVAISEDGKSDPPAADNRPPPTPRIGNSYSRSDGTNERILTYEDVVALLRKRIIDHIDTKGLTTYGDLVDFLRIESGANNIMVAPELQNEKAPQVVMHNVTVGGVLDAICLFGGLHVETRVDGDNVSFFLMPQADPANRVSAPKSKICRVFKASAKEKLASPQLDELLANISDAARKACEVNAKAQGLPAAEAPVIEAHAGTGILIVAGTESDVQLVGQVIQALGGEVVPLTSSVTEFEGFITASKPIESVVTKNGASKPFVVKDAEGNTVEFDATLFGDSPRTSGPGEKKEVEDVRKQLEAARDQLKNLEKQLDQLKRQTPPAPPKAK
jgi:hypothetical protein